METKEWVQLGVGIMIVGTLGWLGTQVFDMRGTLSRVDERVVAIADEMPEIGRFAAWREVDKKFNSTLVAMSPHLDGQQWKQSLILADPNTETARQFTVDLKNQGDLRATYSLIGVANTIDDSSLSYQQLAYFARRSGSDAEVASFVDPSASFVFRKTDSYGKILEVLQGQIGEPSEAVFTINSRKWSELSDELAATQAKLKSPM